MPNFGDDLTLGPVVLGGAALPGPSPQTVGVGPLGRVYLFDVVPLTLQTNGLATSQNPASGGSFALTAGTGVTSRLRGDGTTELVLDTPRCVTLTAAGANTATYIVRGFDQYGQAMSQTLAAPSTSTVATLKAFKTVVSITNNNATLATNGITAGFNDTLGLPLAVTDVCYIQSVKWATTLADNAGTATVADVTSPATAATGDVRGTYGLSSASNNVRRLVMFIATPAIMSGPNATRVGAAGVTQV